MKVSSDEVKKKGNEDGGNDGPFDGVCSLDRRQKVSSEDGVYEDKRNIPESTTSSHLRNIVSELMLKCP